MASYELAAPEVGVPYSLVCGAKQATPTPPVHLPVLVGPLVSLPFSALDEAGTLITIANPQSGDVTLRHLKRREENF